MKRWPPTLQARFRIRQLRNGLPAMFCPEASQSEKPKMKLRTLIAVLTMTFVTAATAFGDAPVTSATTTNPPWDVSAAAGLTLTRGNSKTLLFTANLQGAKKWDQNELGLGIDGV